MLIYVSPYWYQADDPVSVLSEFSQFVQKTVNDEEQVVHKLLGKQFQVRLTFPYISFKPLM